MKRYQSKSNPTEAHFFMKQGYVIVNGDYVSVDAVEFLDISEDITGRDLMTFIYNGETRQSFVVIR